MSNELSYEELCASKPGEQFTVSWKNANKGMQWPSEIFVAVTDARIFTFLNCEIIQLNHSHNLKIPHLYFETHKERIEVSFSRADLGVVSFYRVENSDKFQELCQRIQNKYKKS
jgi:hypothetical protein